MRKTETNPCPIPHHSLNQRDADTRMHFGYRLRLHREARGLGIGCLADLCGIAAQTLEELESDAGIPGLRQLERLCHGLDVSLGELLKR